MQLQGGSGGGGAGGGSGGGGGGAIELGAVGYLTISGRGAINADGATPTYPAEANDGGGGSGGGIFLHADSVLLTGTLSAAGGYGNEGFVNPGPGGGEIGNGGGGGGGEVTILAGPGGFEGSLANINVSGGFGGGDGVINVLSTVPEPASLVPMGTWVLVLLGVGWMRRNGAHAARYPA
jgi:hypothetical protein